MNKMFIILIVIELLFILYLFFKNIGFKKQIGKISSMITPISPESKKSDLTLVYSAIERSIIKVLYEFSTRDYKFNEKSPVKMLVYGHYRDLITLLLRPDIKFDSDISDEGKVSFFETFAIKVYYYYISETSDLIKQLFYKYFSGYTIDEYFSKNKTSKPSIQNFIIEYTRNYLWCRYEENQINENELLEQAGNNSESYVKQLEEYDLKCLQKLSSSIYHMNELDVNNSKIISQEVNK